MARFWLFIANSVGILILVLILIWMAGVVLVEISFPNTEKSPLTGIADRAEISTFSTSNEYGVLKLPDGRWF